MAGMWCLLDAKLAQKSTQPGRHDLWLVEQIDANRVFVVIRNQRTRAKQTVSLERLSLLKIEDLIKFQLNEPTLDSLVKATRLSRNAYVKGADTDEMKFLPEVHQIQSAPSNILSVENPVNKKAFDDSQSANEKVIEDKAEPEEDLKERVDEVSWEQAKEEIPGKVDNVRYNLRSNKYCLSTKIVKSILKSIPVLSTSVETIQGTRSKVQYNCIKRALVLHSEICEQKKCVMCTVHQKIKALSFSGTNTSCSFFKPVVQASSKRVTFHKNTSQRISLEKNHVVSLSSLIKATHFNVSCKEIALL